MKIAIIGAGWYGCHIALALQAEGHNITLYEKNPSIFNQASGKFGIRLHAGPHYPRSWATRESCHRGFDAFKNTYPELVIAHDYSIYGLGVLDSEKQPSKVDAQTFEAVCNESISNQFIDTKTWGYQNLTLAGNIEEPSIVLGNALRDFFKKKISAAGIAIYCNTPIDYTREQQNGCVLIGNDTFSEEFDAVINASSFQSLLPENEKLPVDMEVVYQPCIALRYKDNELTSRPFSFIVMDGWFPCLMPYIEEVQCEHPTNHNYILTHGKWTILGSFHEPEDAYQLLNNLSDNAVETGIRALCEKEMNRFYPDFTKRFEYLDWKGAVIAKLKTKSEFRSAVTFMHHGVIHIIPGKVSNIFDAEKEVKKLLGKQNLQTYNNYHYVKNGVLDTSIHEILEKPDANEQNTCNLQSYYDLQTRLSSNKDSFFKQSPSAEGSPENIPPQNH